MPVALAGDLDELEGVLSYHEPRIAFYERSPPPDRKSHARCRARVPAEASIPALVAVRDGTPLSYLRGVSRHRLQVLEWLRLPRRPVEPAVLHAVDMLDYEEPGRRARRLRARVL